MIKRTLHFGNPAYLSLGNAQLMIHLPHLKEFGEEKSRQSVAIEDIGVVILEHKQITITHACIAALLDNSIRPSNHVLALKDFALGSSAAARCDID